MSHHRQIMGNEYVGQTEISLEVAQQVEHLGLHRHIECGDGLIENYQTGTEC